MHDEDQPGDADDWQLRWAQEEFDRDHGNKHPKFEAFDPERRFELIRGELRPMPPPPGAEHGARLIPAPRT